MITNKDLTIFNKGLELYQELDIMDAVKLASVLLELASEEGKSNIDSEEDQKIYNTLKNIIKQLNEIIESEEK